MSGALILNYITDRAQLPGDETARRRCLLDKIAEAARWGVDYIQLREKNLPTRELEALALEAVCLLQQVQRETGNRKLETRLLINSRTDVALAAGAAGVHLRSDDVSPADVRTVWDKCGAGALARGVVGVSCHSDTEVLTAANQEADFAVFAPVFEKQSRRAPRPVGLEALRQACRHSIPVLALGGVTFENAASCLEAGAAGIAAVRLFQENDIAAVVATLRGTAAG